MLRGSRRQSEMIISVRAREHMKTQPENQTRTVKFIKFVKSNVPVQVSARSSSLKAPAHLQNRQHSSEWCLPGAGMEEWNNATISVIKVRNVAQDRIAARIFGWVLYA